jgi:hypothetical protein
MKLQEQFESAWKAAAGAKALSRGDMLFLALNRAMNGVDIHPNQLLYAFSKEIQEMFTPTTDANKLANGYARWKAVELALPECMKSPGWDFLTAEEHLEYREVIRAMAEAFIVQLMNEQEIELPDADYLYITVRKDLSPEQQVVQAAHAAFIAGVNFGQRGLSDQIDPEGVHFVVLHAEDEFELLEAFDFDAEKFNFDLYPYYERDRHEFTAVASPVITGKTREVYKGKPLLKFDTSMVEIVFKPEDNEPVAFRDISMDDEGLTFVPGWGAFDLSKFNPIVVGSGDLSVSEIRPSAPVYADMGKPEYFLGGFFNDITLNGRRISDEVYGADYWSGPIFGAPGLGQHSQTSVERNMQTT